MRNRGFQSQAVAAVLVIAIFGAAASVAWGTAPGRNGKLAFRRFLDADHTWSALFAGDSAPAWSPDGRRIAFQRALLAGNRDAVS